MPANLVPRLAAAIKSSPKPFMTAEDQLSLLKEMIRILTTEVSFDNLITELLAAIGRCGKWEFGALWLKEHEEWRCQGIWQAKPRRTAKLAEAMQAATIGETKDSLLNMAWGKPRPIWVTDLRAIPSTRLQEICEAGLSAGLLLPFYGGKGQLGVIEFFTT